MLFAGIAAVVLLPMIWFIVPDRYESPAPLAGEGDSDAAEEVTMGDVARMPVFLCSAAVFSLAARISTGWPTHVAASLTWVGQYSLLAPPTFFRKRQHD